MHCQQYLVGYFYATWSAITNGIRNTSISDLHKLTDSGLETMDLMKNIAASNVRDLDGPGCTISLSCQISRNNAETSSVQVDWKAFSGHKESECEAELNLNLTLTSTAFQTDDGQGCKDRLEELLLNKQEYGLHRRRDLPRRQPPFIQTENDHPHLKPKLRQRPIHQREAPTQQNILMKRYISESSTLDYSRIFSHLFSFFQRRTIRDVVNVISEGSLKFRATFKRMSVTKLPSVSIISPRRWKQTAPKGPSPSRRSDCEDTFCKGYSLENICGQHKTPNVELDTEDVCKMCYPTRNDDLIKAHCEEKTRREIQVFHILCVALGVITAFAAFLYLLCEVCRPLRKRWELYWKIRTGQISKNRLSSIFSVESNPAFPPGYFFNTGFDAEDGDNAGKMADMFSMLPQKLNPVATGLKEPRKRIQDVFDLEALEPRPDRNESIFPERIPVLPPAPNASVRRSFSNRIRRGNGNGRHEISAQDFGHGPLNTTRYTADMSRKNE
ncbi:hypothetical protein PHISCL_03741 [Aspergillus sclerotialis]|uniref:Uncharacterized protein n=1 Tax=Aspergillus sclerotialis TaxID=2070753 RepID=A0A3A3A1A3_9EURO|nr:hypothetical protein PHISCL_03741 [Aspergillus sclerotialis]